LPMFKKMLKPGGILVGPGESSYAVGVVAVDDLSSLSLSLSLSWSFYK